MRGQVHESREYISSIKFNSATYIGMIYSFVHFGQLHLLALGHICLAWPSCPRGKQTLGIFCPLNPGLG